MASEDEIIMAAEAVRCLVPKDYGMTWDEAKGYARAALEAAEREREKRRIATCTHFNKWGSGTLSSDGSSKLDWHCKDCGKSFHSETPPRPPAPIDILSIPQN